MEGTKYYTCGIIEDEALAYSLLEKYILRMGLIEIKWSTPSVDDVLADAHEKVDIVFLDLINSPLSIYTKIDHEINQYGNIVITTAHNEKYVNTLGIDYLQLLNKPFSYKIFEETINEVMIQLQSVSKIA